MLGKMISTIREKQNLSKTDLADVIGINVGHLTHIEKGERNPSQKTLRDICKALSIPYQPLYNMYDKEYTPECEQYHLENAMPYTTIPLISDINSMIYCPPSIPNASLAFIMQDDSMKSSAPKGSYLYLELNAIPEHRELGLFQYNDKLLVRRILYRKNKIVLKSDSLLAKDIVIEDGSQFTIIGKVYVRQ